MQWRKLTRLKTATGNSRTRRMLCCGRRKENGRSVPDLTASPGRAPPAPMPPNQNVAINQRQLNNKEPVLLQGDFRKVSGISSEIFRQIETVENDYDPSTAAALDSVERRGEMIVRILEARCIGGRKAVESAQKLLAKEDARHSVQLIEIVKRPGQTLGLYIREGNGADRSDGVFISRIALESAVYNSGCLRVGDEILAVNLVDVTHMSLDDVVIIMSIPRRLVLAIRQRRGGRGTNSPVPTTLSRPEQKPPPVVVIKRDLRDEESDELDRVSRSRSSRERRTGDGREMTESRSRLGLGLNNYSPQSEQLDLYYNSRQNTINEPNWNYKPPPPPSAITEQPKSHTFAPSHAYYQNAGTLESLAEKVHSFCPGPNRRMSTGTGIGGSQSHIRFPRSGSDQHLPKIDFSHDFSSLSRNSLLRSSLKSGVNPPGGTLGRYPISGRFDPQQIVRPSKFGPPPSQVALTRRSRPTLDYSSDTEATVSAPRSNYYYYNRPAMNSIPRGGSSVLGAANDFAKFNSLPRERPGARLGLRARVGDRLVDESDGNLSAPELPARQLRDLRNRITAPNPSIFTSDEYRAWLRRAPSSSAIYEQMRTSRDILNQQRAHRFSCSAENIHDALKNTESIYSNRIGGLTNTLDRHINIRGITSAPIRSLSTQHIGSGLPLRSPSIRRMRQMLELSGGATSPGSAISGHQSPAPTPSTTLPRPQRQIDINPAEYSKYKLEKPVLDIGSVSGMIWIHLLAGRGLRMTPEGTQPMHQNTVRDLYCVLECDRIHKARTVVRSGDLQFDWDESFELDLVSNKQLDVLVYSWDPQHRHKLCYRGAVSLSTLLKQSPLHQLALKVEPRGTIYLRLRYTDPQTLYRRRGLPSLRASYPQLFGADLEAVVAREAKLNPGQAPVPIVLRRCVEEIERRGLDIIGLYRLCGSATKKRLLREAFERNCRAVELTPDHVPDINVITGVLKDYLRELPEPLFTRCLFQMTVDALGVCLPDDPEGNAKLMLSILDCLPRANRATLVCLLDHLSLVVSASERNKMSAQALATVIGPPLMLHSQNSNTGSEVDHAQPIAVLKYLLQIWPQPQTSNVSGHRNEPQEQRGNKVNASQVDKFHRKQHIMNETSSLNLDLTTIPIGHNLPSATHSNQPYQSAVAQSHPSLRASQQVAHQHLHQSVGSAGLMVQGRLPQPETPSPESSSTSTNSGSGSGKSADTVKRGASPISLTSSLSSSKLKENSSFSTIISEADTLSLERYRNGNGVNTKNVLFAPNIEISSSSYSIKDHTHLNSNHPNLMQTSIASTSQRIKDTLSSSSALNKTPNLTLKQTSNSREVMTNNITLLPTENCQFLTKNILMNNINSNDIGKLNKSLISSANDESPQHRKYENQNNSLASTHKSSSKSSPLSRLSDTHTNTLPSNIGRDCIQYKSDSNYLVQTKPKSIAKSSGIDTVLNAFSVGMTINSTTSNQIWTNSHIKEFDKYDDHDLNTINSLNSTSKSSNSNANSYGGVSAVANEFERIIARGTGNSTFSHLSQAQASNYNSMNSYRMPYSSTNPFLPNFDPQQPNHSDEK